MSTPVEFAKVHGAGNDFILVDNRAGHLPAEDDTRYARWCDRHMGIGADGLILLENTPGADFRMRYFNADGRPGSLCGNGARCAVWQALHWGFFTGTHTRFQAGDLTLTATVVDASSPGAAIVVMRPWTDTPVHTAPDGDAYVHTGSPHVLCVLPAKQSLADLDLPTLALPIRHNPSRPGGTNVNVIQPNPDGSLHIRTFERGVEAETLACGTGVTAAALYWAQQQHLPYPWRLTVHARGGTLWVEAEADGTVRLGGPVEAVFTGKLP